MISLALCTEHTNKGIRANPPVWQRMSPWAGLATSEDGIQWQRGGGAVAGRAGREEVGRVLAPNNEDWWWLDTAHVSVSDVQVRAVRIVDPTRNKQSEVVMYTILVVTVSWRETLSGEVHMSEVGFIHAIRWCGTFEHMP